MVKIVYFGERMGENFQIQSSIEYAFDAFKSKLSSFMTDVGSVVTHTFRIDSFDNKFCALHNEYRSQLSAIPSYYELNEILLNELVHSNMTLTYAILPQLNREISIIENVSSGKKKCDKL